MGEKQSGPREHCVSRRPSKHPVTLAGRRVLIMSRFGAAAKEHEKLFYNDAGFLLAMAIADDALFGYESLEDVRKQKVPDGEDELVLRFKDSALEQPVLRQCTKTGGVTDEPMPRSSFTSILKSTLTNAGYLSGPSIHAIRRQLGKGVDSKSSDIGFARFSLSSQDETVSNSCHADLSTAVRLILLLTSPLRTIHLCPTLSAPDASRSANFRSELRCKLFLRRWSSGVP